MKSESEVAQSCPTLSNPMDCSPPGSSDHGIFQARVLEWGAIAFSKKSFRFTEKLNGTHTHFSYTPKPPRQSLPVIDSRPRPQGNGASVTLMNLHLHDVITQSPQITIQLVHSQHNTFYIGLPKCVMTCIHPFNIK